MEDFWRRFDLLYNHTADQSAPLTKRLTNANHQPGDVIVTGFPKSGTTWCQQILHQLRSGGTDDSAIYAVTKYIPYYFEALPDFDPDHPVQKWKPRVFKNHDMYDWAPKCDGLKFIVCVRDEPDALWSLSQYVVGFLGCRGSLSSNELVRFMKASALQAMGNWKQFLLSWYPHRNDADVLFVHFEDLKENLPACVEKIGKFVGIEVSPALRDAVVKRSSFEYMSANKEKFQEDDGVLKVMKSAIQDDWQMVSYIVRPGGGAVGEGKAKISPEAREYFEHEWQETVGKELGVKTYAELRQRTSLLTSKR